MKYYQETELQEIAREKSKTIVIRTYNNGNSNDERRDATPEEQENIYKLLYAGLLAINFRHGKEYQGVMDACEYAGHLFLPENTNCYDTIYLPLYNFWYENNSED